MFEDPSGYDQEDIGRTRKATPGLRGIIIAAAIGVSAAGGMLLLEAGIFKRLSSVNVVGKTGLTDQIKSGKTPVIGKMQHLKVVGKSEVKVADYLPNLRNPKLNWKQNSGVLRQVINQGKRIRDASPFNGKLTNDFLGMERNLLKSRGWTYNKGYWNPPK